MIGHRRTLTRDEDLRRAAQRGAAAAIANPAGGIRSGGEVANRDRAGLFSRLNPESAPVLDREGAGYLVKAPDVFAPVMSAARIRHPVVWKPGVIVNEFQTPEIYIPASSFVRRSAEQIQANIESVSSGVLSSAARRVAQEAFVAGRFERKEDASGAEYAETRFSCEVLIHADLPDSEWSYATVAALSSRSGTVGRGGGTGAPLLYYALIDPADPHLQSTDGGRIKTRIFNADPPTLGGRWMGHGHGTAYIYGSVSGLYAAFSFKRHWISKTKVTETLGAELIGTGGERVKRQTLTTTVTNTTEMIRIF